MVGETVPAERKAARGASEEYFGQHNSADENCERQPSRVCPKSEDPNGDGLITCRSRSGNSVEDRFELLSMKEEELEEDENGSLGLLSFDSNDTSHYSLSGTAWWNFWP